METEKDRAIEPTEIEITPEMIEAGTDVLRDLISWGGDRGGFFDRDHDFVEMPEVVSLIYRAMAILELRQAQV